MPDNIIRFLIIFKTEFIFDDEFALLDSELPLTIDNELFTIFKNAYEFIFN